MARSAKDQNLITDLRFELFAAKRKIHEVLADKEAAINSVRAAFSSLDERAGDTQRRLDALIKDLSGVQWESPTDHDRVNEALAAAKGEK